MIMRSGKQVFLGMILLILLLAAVFVALWWIRLIIVVFAAGTARFWCLSLIKEQELTKQSLEEDSRKFLINILNRYRHDWLNDLQVISGYAQLKRTESITPYIQKVREQLSSDSAISRLGIPSLACELFVWKSSNHNLQLAVMLEKDTDLSGLPVQQELIKELVLNTIACFHDHSLIAAADAKPALLQISIEPEEQHLVLEFEFSGKYNERELVASLQKTIGTNQYGVVALHDFREEEVDVQFRIPFIAYTG